MAGPHLGPVRTVLWSGSTRGRRRRARASWWQRRMRSPFYWLLGLCLLELAARVLAVVACLAAAIVITVRKGHNETRPAR